MKIRSHTWDANITTRNNNRHAVFAACVDIASVVLFVAVGRRNHAEGTAIDGIAVVAAPFLIALGIAWLTSRAWRTPGSLRTSVIVWLITVFGGLELRHFVFDRGIAMPFVIVTTIVLCACIVGGRFVLNLRFGR